MSATMKTERRVLAGPELQAVEQSHYPAIQQLSSSELGELAKRLRDYRGKAQDVARGRRRERRGKAEPRGAGPAPDESGLTLKAQVFAAALKRVNREVGRLRKTERSQGELGRKALEMKRAARADRHPRAGRTPSQGMRAIPSDMPSGDEDPRESIAAPEATRTP